MNPYDHEDAFREANLYAGSVTNLSGALRHAESREVAKALIQDAQKFYEAIFDAFIAGVDHGRKNPNTARGGTSESAPF